MTAAAVDRQASHDVRSVQAVQGYADVLGQHDLRAGDALAVLDTLAVSDAGEAVFWVPDWFHLDATISTTRDARNVFAATPETDTAAAWRIRQGNARTWLSKKHALAFELATGANLPVVERGETA